MPHQTLATMVTTTSYGTWLPGDMRGYVEGGEILPASPSLLSYAKQQLAKSPVYFTPAEQDIVYEALVNASGEFGCLLTDVSLESWHVHWICSHGADPVPKMVGRLKTRMRQALDRGRVWTEGYCRRCLRSPPEIGTARAYIARHAGCRMIDGRDCRGERPPGRAGG